MTPADSAGALIEFAERHGCDLKRATPALGMSAMLAFFREVRPDARLADCDGDMLLYQWGVYDWGKGPSFQLDLTRQFIAIEGEEEDDQEVMSQLALTFHLPPTDDAKAFGKGDRWCKALSDLDPFVEFIRGSPPYAAFKETAPERVDVRWYLV